MKRAIPGLFLAALLVAGCGGEKKKPEAQGPGREGQEGGVAFEVLPGDGKPSLVAGLVTQGEGLALAISPDANAQGVSGAQFELVLGDGVEVTGDPATGTPLMIFHTVDGRRHRFVLFSLAGAQARPDEELLRLPISVEGLEGQTEVVVEATVISDEDGEGGNAQDRTTQLRRVEEGS